jgi:EAL and modified HD-GYP domain-containing signal transduction protein
MLSWIARLFGRRTPAEAAKLDDTHIALDAGERTPVHDTLHDEAGDGTPRELEGALFQRDLLDASRRAVGYLFSLHEGRNAGLRTRSARVRQLFDSELIDQLQKLTTNWPAQRFALLPLDDVSLAHPKLPQLARLRAIVLLGPVPLDEEPAPETIEQIRLLRQAGIRFALIARPNSARFEALAPLVDELVMVFANRDPAELRMQSRELAKRFPAMPRIGFEVQNIDEFDLAIALGCRAVSGDFSRERGDWRANRIAPNHLRIAELLARVGKEDDFHEIAKTLKQDVALSYRLLRYVNSAASGLQAEIGSIEQALLIMGQRPLGRWLSLLFFAGSKNGGEQDPLMEAALVRARMMETLGARLAFDQREDLFMTGVFSLLDLVLKVPMAEALAPLHLSAPIRAALLEGTGPYAPALAAAVACEEGDLASLRVACSQLGTAPIVACNTHIDALAWVHASTQNVPA